MSIVATLAAIAIPTFQGYQDRARMFQTVRDIGDISLAVQRYVDDNRVQPNSLADVGRDSLLDPWGHPYVYIGHENPKNAGIFRKDKRIVPLNTDFDVFSAGKDGVWRPPITAAASRDDIVRANDGAFIGLASEYDP